MESILFVASIGILIWSLILQRQMKSVFRKYGNMPISTNVSGEEVARTILTNRGINSIEIAPIQGELTDNYNPTKNVVSLSTPVFSNASIASAAVAAHEIGHVLQYHENSILMKIRTTVLPAASFGGNSAMPLFFAGLIFNMGFLMQLGVIFFAAVFLFHLITLPVELDASRRAINILVEDGYLTSKEEEKGARKVLRYAAFTYLASLLMSLVQLLRMFLLSRRD